MPEGFDELVRDPGVHDAVMPGWNGVFTARALARMYGGDRERRRGSTAAVPAPNHRADGRGADLRAATMSSGPAALAARLPPADPRDQDQPRNASATTASAVRRLRRPDSGLSLGFVTNRLGRALTALGDLRLARLGAEAQAIVRNGK